MDKITNEQANYIENKMKQFKLVDMRHQYVDIINEAIMNSSSYVDFLIRLLEVEDEGKRNRKTELLLNKAGFDSTKTLDEIDYSFNSSLNRKEIEELGNLNFMDEHGNIVIIGPPGVGKTMIATAVGINACHNGYKVLFVNAKEFVDTLHNEMTSGNLDGFLKKISSIDLLIVDELSYIKMDKERESLFFQIIRQRYEKSSLIITTNLPIGRWDEIFTGQLAATAILDRVLHHCHLLSITGDSYRVKGRKQIKLKKENT